MSDTGLEFARLIMDAWDTDHEVQRFLIKQWKDRAKRADEDRAELVQEIADLRRKYGQPDMAERRP